MKNPKAEVVAIADGKFIYVWNKKDVKSFIGAGTTEEFYDDGLKTRCNDWQALLAYQKYFLELGITMTFDPMVNLDYGWENVMEAYYQLDIENKLKLRVNGNY